MKKKSLILIILGVAIVGFIIAAVVFGNKGDSSETLFVTTSVVKADDVTSRVNATGVVSSKSSFDISSKATGEVSVIHVKEGDFVKKGQVLCELDQSDILNQITETEIQLEIAKENLVQIINQGSNNYKSAYRNGLLSRDSALKAYEDEKKLHEAGVSSQASLDAAKTAYQQASNSFEETRAKYNNENSASDIKIQELRIQSLENALANQKENLDDMKIKSPIDGVITSENVKLLAYISPGSPIYKIEDMTQLVVDINVSQYDIHKLAVGQSVVIKAEGAEKEEFSGQVSSIGSRAVSKVLRSSQEMVIEVEIDITSEETNLKPNFSVKTEIETAHVSNALVLPYEAVYIDKDGNKIVFTVKDGQITEHKIERGVEGMFMFQAITDTIQVDDHIILNPNEDITLDKTVIETEVKE